MPAPEDGAGGGRDVASGRSPRSPTAGLPPPLERLDGDPPAAGGDAVPEVGDSPLAASPDASPATPGAAGDVMSSMLLLKESEVVVSRPWRRSCSLMSSPEARSGRPGDWQWQRHAAGKRVV